MWQGPQLVQGAQLDTLGEAPQAHVGGRRLVLLPAGALRRRAAEAGAEGEVRTLGGGVAYQPSTLHQFLALLLVVRAGEWNLRPSNCIQWRPRLNHFLTSLSVVRPGKRDRRPG